jgi:hypothetical protein
VAELNPVLFLKLAKELADGTAEDVKLRTAVSRAYYACFLVARDKTGVNPFENSIHTTVIKELKKRRSYWATASQLDTMRRLRTVADYEMLPLKPGDRDWKRNWLTVSQLATKVLPYLDAW